MESYLWLYFNPLGALFCILAPLIHIMRKLFCLFLLLSHFFLKGQELKGDKYYNIGDYNNAIPFYEKALRKLPSSKLYEKLGNCYRYTQSYQKAENAYLKGITLDSSNAFLHFLYGNSLRYNGKNDEAKQQFLTYLRLAPQDDILKNKIKSFDELSILFSRSLTYKIDPINGLNTNYAEFSPVFFQKGIVFTAERFNDLVNIESEESQLPNFDLYFQEVNYLDSSVVLLNKSKPFNDKINSLLPDGPCTFDKKQKTTAFARLEVNSNGIARSKVYFSSYENNRWQRPLPYSYNNNEYSISHPALSKDGQTLYFSSDLPGGVGGKDLYVSHKDLTGWSGPENLGPTVNTIGDELFPYISNDTVLYFSSDGHTGFGNLDIFKTTFTNNRWITPENLGSPLNSSTDDFGIAVDSTGRRGFFSSDRNGGKGKDDIYCFIQKGQFVEMSGRILLSSNVNDPAKNVKVLLLTEEGKVLLTIVTDSNGFFSFKELDPGQQYLVKLDESDPSLKKQNQYFMEDTKKNKIVQITVLNDRGEKFVYENLQSDENNFSRLEVRDDAPSDFSGYLVVGDVSMAPIPNCAIKLRSDTNKLNNKTTTNANGFFVFRNIDPGNNFFVEVDENDPRLKNIKNVAIANKEGKILMVLKKQGNAFQFQYLSAELNKFETMFVEDDGIKKMIQGKIKSEKNTNPIAALPVYLFNNNHVCIDTTYTDKMGGFLFRNLSQDESYYIEMDATDPKLQSNRYRLLDGAGNFIKELSKENNKFTFQSLANEYSGLSALYADDVGLPKILSGRLLNGANNSVVVKMGVSLVDASGKIIRSETTDSDGRFVFRKLNAEENYLIALDENDPRVKEIGKFLLVDEKGHVVKELDFASQKQYRFELLNSEQIALEKIEIKDALFVYDIHGKLSANSVGSQGLKNITVKLQNSSGEIVSTTKTDSLGKFLFRTLPIDEKYLFVVDANDPGIMGLNKIYFVTNGRVAQTITRLTTRDFKFELLEADKSKYGEIYAGDINLNQGFFGQLNSDGRNLSNATIFLYDTNGVMLGKTTTDAQGNFIFEKIALDQNFLLKIDATDANIKSFKNISIKNIAGESILITSTKEGNFEYELISAELNKLKTESPLEEPLFAYVKKMQKIAVTVNTIEFKNVLFDYNSFVLPFESKPRLDTLAIYLQHNKKVLIDLYGHTDAKGSASYNKMLSEKRAEAAKNYLIKKGVASKRIRIYSLGAERPLEANTLNDGADNPQGRKFNRRVEIRIIY